MLRASPMLWGGGAGGVTLPQNVFATSLYSSDGGARAVTTGFQPDFLWTKSRNQVLNHLIQDVPRGISNVLNSDTTGAENANYGPHNGTVITSTGFTLAADQAANNTNGYSYAAWSFRKAPKFFDIVTYTGDGTSGRQIAHSLGIAPGMVVVKRRDAIASWPVYHRSLANPVTDNLYLERTQANQTNGIFGSASSASFTVNNSGAVNEAGATYVAYLFAHDPDTTNGIIQCGTYTETGSNVAVTLGWQPQYIMVKSTNVASGWWIADASRTPWTSSSQKFLRANGSNAEVTDTVIPYPTSTGFIQPPAAGAGTNWIYLAIRAPIFQGALRPQDAYATSLYTGTGANQSIVNGLNLSGNGGMVWPKARSAVGSHSLWDTVRGANKYLSSNATTAENTASPTEGVRAFNANGFSLGTNAAGENDNGSTQVAWSFVRKPKFFDVVTYTGDGTSGRQIAHALGVAPGMVIIKRRDTTGSWYVYHRGLTTPATDLLALESTGAQFTVASIFGSAPSATTFTVGTSAAANAAGGQFVAYLFAHDPSADGIVQCVSGADGAFISLPWRPQFIMSKSATNVDPWVIRDATRGFGQYLQPNLTNAEASAGFGTTTSTGFTYANLGSGTNIHLAIREPTT